MRLGFTAELNYSVSTERLPKTLQVQVDLQPELKALLKKVDIHEVSVAEQDRKRPRGMDQLIRKTHGHAAGEESSCLALAVNSQPVIFLKSSWMVARLTLC